MKILRKTMPILSAVLLLASCSKEAGKTDDPSFDGKKGVLFSFSTPNMDSQTVSTRAGVNDEELKHLRVLQFDGTSDAALLTFNETYTSSNLESGNKLYVDLDETSGTTIYVVANAEASTSLASLSKDYTTLGDFKTLTLDFAKEADVTADDVLPMFGVAGPFSNSEATVKLTRMVAKVSFTCTVDIPASTKEQFKIQNIQLLDAANKVLFVAKTGSSSDNVFPVADVNNFFDYVEEAAAPTEEDEISRTWFVPENLKGTITNTDPKKKDTDHAPKRSTYVDVSGYYTNKDGDEEPVTYRIYLGANATDDFDLVRNNAYTIKVTIKGKNEHDTRVLVNKGVPAGQYEDGGEW